MSRVSDGLPFNRFPIDDSTQKNDDAFKSNYEMLKKIVFDDSDIPQDLVQLKFNANKRNSDPGPGGRSDLVKKKSSQHLKSRLSRNLTGISCKQEMNKVATLILINCGEDSVLVWDDDSRNRLV